MRNRRLEISRSRTFLFPRLFPLIPSPQIGRKFNQMHASDTIFHPLKNERTSLPLSKLFPQFLFHGYMYIHSTRFNSIEYESNRKYFVPQFAVHLDYPEQWELWLICVTESAQNTQNFLDASRKKEEISREFNDTAERIIKRGGGGGEDSSDKLKDRERESRKGWTDDDINKL